MVSKDDVVQLPDGRRGIVIEADFRGGCLIEIDGNRSWYEPENIEVVWSPMQTLSYRKFKL